MLLAPILFFFLIGQDDTKKIKSIFRSEDDSTAKFYVCEELEHLISRYLKCMIQKVIR